MDLRKLKTLIDLVSDSNVTELEITEAEGKVRIVKGAVASGAPMFTQQVMVPATPQAPVSAAAPSVAEIAEAAAVSAAAVAAEAASAGHTVKSPMVGTFYRSSSPGAAPFVQVGDTVKEGVAGDGLGRSGTHGRVCGSDNYGLNWVVNDSGNYFRFWIAASK